MIQTKWKQKNLILFLHKCPAIHAVVVVRVVGAKVDDLPIGWPDLIGSPLLVWRKLMTLLDDEIRIIPVELGHVFIIDACGLGRLKAP